MMSAPGDVLLAIIIAGANAWRSCFIRIMGKKIFRQRFCGRLKKIERRNGCAELSLSGRSGFNAQLFRITIYMHVQIGLTGL